MKSQLKTGWTEQKCIEMDQLAQQDHTYRLSKEVFKRYQGQWYLGRCDFDQTFELQSQSKTVSIKKQAKKSHNAFLLNNIRDGTLPRAIPGGTGTRPKAGGAHEKTIYLFF